MSTSTAKHWTLRISSDELSIPFTDGESFLDGILQIPSIPIDALCGGSGRCGKCSVQVTGEGLPAAVRREKELFSREELNQGWRLACLTRAFEGAVVTLNGQSEIQALSDLPEFTRTADPEFTRKAIPLARKAEEAPSYYLAEKLDLKKASFSPRIIRSFQKAEADGNATELSAVFLEDRLHSLSTAGTAAKLPVFALDIGTTTVALYLLDLETAAVLAVRSGENRQKRYGADVLSRIRHAQEKGGLEALQQTIVRQIEEMAASLADEAGLAHSGIPGLYVAGNTTMIHLLLGWDPEEIGRAPFTPASLSVAPFAAGDIGFRKFPGMQISVVSGVSAYIGGDVVAAAVYAGLDDCEGPSLLIDLGTNGEMMLKTGDTILACSTAAGPAFEGATIACGTGGVPGAISEVFMDEDGGLRCTTISGRKPIGICGSGIIDTVAVLLDEGIISPEGALDGEGSRLLSRITEDGGSRRFILHSDGTSGMAQIVFTEKDVREIQLAKAAISSGVDVLLKEADLEVEDISRVFLAGGFGNHLKKESAFRIGLFPDGLQEKVTVIGNGAGKGACLAAMYRDTGNRITSLLSRTRYIELSGYPEYQEFFIERLFFP